MATVWSTRMLAELARLSRKHAGGPDGGHGLRHHAVDAEARHLEDHVGVEPVRRLREEIERAQTDEERPGAGQAHPGLALGNGKGVLPAGLVVIEGEVEQLDEQRSERSPRRGLEEV